MVNKKDSWIKEKYAHPNDKQGFSGWNIHQEPDLALLSHAKLVFKGTPPHNHGTWSITAGVTKEEEHIIYHPLPRPYQKKHQLTIKKILVCKPGTIIHLGNNALHSVKNKMNDINSTFYLWKAPKLYKQSTN